MLVMIFSLVFCVFAQDISWDVQQDVLRDGLKLNTHIVPDTKMASVMFRYQIPDSIPEGVAHFVEHLMFSYRNDDRTYDQILEQMGGESQGSTDLATMKLNVRIPIESWDDWVLLEKNRQESACIQIEDDIFEAQRMVIIQEYMQGSGMKERAYAQELRTATFGKRGMGRSVIGSVDDISDWNKEQICEHMNVILSTIPVDIFVVGDVAGVDLIHDMQAIFSRHHLVQASMAPKQQITHKQIQHTGQKEQLYVLWPIPAQSHLDTLFIRYWMMMMTHTKFGVLQKRGVQSRGWIEYGSQGGYLLLQLRGRKGDKLQRVLRTHMYGIGGWVTVFRYASLISKVYHRSVVHSWKTLEGRLLWLEHCVDSGLIETCFDVDYSFSVHRLEKVKKSWLRWDKASFVKVVFP